MEKEYRILITNGGSTSTKIAVRENHEVLLSVSVKHTTKELEQYQTIWDQYDYRKQAVLKVLEEADIKLDSLDALVTRGGNMRAVEGGIYEIGEQMLEDMKSGLYGSHPCSVCNQIAYDMGKELGIPALVVDPPMTDELCSEARFSGSAAIQRISSFHALNQKATARKICGKMGKAYEDTDMIVVHLGGGISVGAHKKGCVIDVNNALDGDGPFSPERSGDLPVGALIRLCYSGQYTCQEMLRQINGRGGLVSYLGTADCLEVEQCIKEGDELAEAIYRAMAYQVAKAIGGAAAVLCGHVEAIAFTGSLAFSECFIGLIKERIEFIAPVYLYPGENEMEALGDGCLRYLTGQEAKKVYPYTDREADDDKTDQRD